MTSVTSSRGPSGAILIIGATGIAGIAGYVVTWLVYRNEGPAAYAVFAIFWSALFLMVGSLSGVQQEITRATRLSSASPGTARPSRARAFGFVLAAAVAAAVIASAPLWKQSVFPEAGWSLVWPLAVGAGSYVLVAVLCGTLYGVAQWRSLALMLVVDGILRLALVGIGLALALDIVATAWAVALPFGLTIVLLWPIIRGGIVNRTELDVGHRPLAWNVARTVAASLSTAVLVSGFPLLLGVVKGDTDAALLGELIFTITLSRAPLIVTVMSLQSYLLVRFREEPQRATRLLIVGVATIAACAAVLAVGGMFFGAPALAWFTAHPTQISGTFIALLLISSGAVAALCVTGSAVLAHGKHVIYLLGWLVAALGTVAVLIMPFDFMVRVGVAVIAAPAAGLVVHLTWLAVRARQQTE